jgi:hypothetical protein
MRVVAKSETPLVNVEISHLLKSLSLMFTLNFLLCGFCVGTYEVISIFIHQLLLIFYQLFRTLISSQGCII